MLVIFLWIGIFLLWLGTAWKKGPREEEGARESVASQGAVPIDGEIAGYVEKPGQRAQRMYSPLIRFTDPDGRTRKVVGPVAQSHITATPGSRVPLLWIPGAPPKLRVAGGLTTGLGSAFQLFGAVFVAVFFAAFSWKPFDLVVAALVSAVLAFRMRRMRSGLPAALKGVFDVPMPDVSPDGDVEPPPVPGRAEGRQRAGARLRGWTQAPSQADSELGPEQVRALQARQKAALRRVAPVLLLLGSWGPEACSGARSSCPSAASFLRARSPCPG